VGGGERRRWVVAEEMDLMSLVRGVDWAAERHGLCTSCHLGRGGKRAAFGEAEAATWQERGGPGQHMMGDYHGHGGGMDGWMDGWMRAVQTKTTVIMLVVVTTEVKCSFKQEKQAAARKIHNISQSATRVATPSALNDEAWVYPSKVLSTDVKY
jgi:hypothetical protein